MLRVALNHLRMHAWKRSFLVVILVTSLFYMWLYRKAWLLAPTMDCYPVYKTLLQEVRQKKADGWTILWSNDLHRAPIYDLQHLWRDFNVLLLDNNLTPVCHVTQSCANPCVLKDLDLQAALRLDDGTIEKFHNRYANESLMNLVDGFVCTYPVSNCELFLKFNRPIVLMVATRYDMGRATSEKRWQKWNENLRNILSSKRNIVVTNSLYDREYMRYFTGHEVDILPSICDYTEYDYVSYDSNNILFVPDTRRRYDWFIRQWRNQSQEGNLLLQPMPGYIKYPWDFNAIVNHRLAVVLPKQPADLTLCEFYSMALPLVYPSKDLLVNWTVKYDILSERTTDQILGAETAPRKSVIKGVLNGVPDPNKFDRKSLVHWLGFADPYNHPHVTYFDSMKDLVHKLKNVDFIKINSDMKEHLSKERDRVIAEWKKKLISVFKNTKTIG